jgi:tetratricopeptide (TPR) repeat protein
VAEVPGESVAAAAGALMLAGRWELAGELLDGAVTEDPAEAGHLALARAQLATERNQWHGEGSPGPVLDEAARVIGAANDERIAQDLELFRLFNDYWAALQPAAPGQPPRFGPDAHDPAALDQLRDRAQWLAGAAPDQGRAARAWFYAGLIADNLRGEAEQAAELFQRALDSCGPHDDLIAAEALRHLGYLSFQAGDRKLARERWERSTERAERGGSLTLTLAQQLLLAELDQAEQDEAGARLRAAEVRRWALAIGVARLARQAEELNSLS